MHKKGTMQRELQRIFTSIKEKTGVDITSQSIDGSFEASTFSDYFTFDNLELFKENEIVQDDEYSYFTFVFGGVKYFSAIIGADEKSKNYAVLVKELIESSQPKEVVLSYDEQLLSILTGDCSRNRIFQFVSKYSISNTSCFCMLVDSQKSKAEEVRDFLSDYSFCNSDSAVNLNKDSCVFVKFTEKDSFEEYRSPTEYAKTIVRSLYEELGINAKIYIGGFVSNFIDIAVSYKQALYAKECANNFGYKNSVCAYKDFAILKITEELSSLKAQEMLTALSYPAIEEVLNDQELFETAENFLSNDLNVSETSRVMHIHRNTLMYRLDKIEKLTGLDIKKFNDALDFRLISIILKRAQH